MYYYLKGFGGDETLERGRRESDSRESNEGKGAKRREPAERRVSK